MQCPKCGSDCWNNTTTKRSPKQPDYKCKDKNCDGAVWLKKNSAAPAGTGKPTGSYQKKDYGDNVPKSMYGAWAMNLVIAMLNNKLIKVAELPVAYEKSLALVNKALHGIALKPAPVATEKPKPAAKVEEPLETQTVDEVPEEEGGIDGITL